ncbi:hypothetical protein M1V28_31160 (plasmid) [Pseudomonas aeruginosa]|uniref:DUF7688 family protein n=1 Tax=Pseudomonas aeruginosa TaxID=287 RepID=UPI001A1C3EAA|nr:hypothetical protein [Pseudomonas aeruginosa]MBH4314692.1 hypothetical protein [Pseudomonas aeruginosa]MBH8699238.1 hypothetical protein [Pseudomonas aeruginosa]WBM10866.1 hypothetical protein M1V28_31160 [Pseudomonas aeruginosa]HEK3608601.1 hypothetical protein [Pseudomonas aeruginosa]
MSSNSDNLTHKIELNGEFLIKGDESSIMVLWKNLTGENFKQPRPWNKDYTHEAYLRMVEHEWKADLAAGGIITLHRLEGDVAIAIHTLGTSGMAMIHAAGTAPELAAEGYKMLRTTVGTDASVLAEHAAQDVRLVRGWTIFGEQGKCEFAVMAKVQ